jgi:hypothetical protein
MGGRAPWRAQRPPRTHEWLQIADAWKGDPPSRVWFVAHPLRTDLALVDPSSVRLLRQDRHPDAVRWLVTGLRPEALDWYEITRPNWIALRGWALTPETAGTATRDGRGLDVGPISALVRPLGEPALLLLGGRHLGEAGAPPARVTIQFGDTPLDSFDVAASPREFLRFVEVPRRSAAPQYVPLTITAATSGRSTAPVAIEQFDYQPASSVIAGFGRGWHEPELDPRRGLQWRWTSAEADLHIRAQGDVRVTVAGESPLRYFDSPARLRLRAAGLDVGERSLAADYREAFCIPHQLLKASSGRLTLATDLTFVPRDRDGSADARTLGLRVFDVKVVPANCGSQPAR